MKKIRVENQKIESREMKTLEIKSQISGAALGGNNQVCKEDKELFIEKVGCVKEPM